AKYIPKVALPSSFKAQPNDSSVINHPALGPDAVAKTDESSTEKQAAFTEPAKQKSDADDRYPVPPTKSDNAPREPAQLDAPPAKAISPDKPQSTPAIIHIANAPSFSADDVSTALQAAKEAQPKLMAGNLGDSQDVQ